MSIEATLVPVQPEPSAGRSKSLRLLALAVALVVVAGCAAFAWRWRHDPPQSFTGGYGLETKRQVGKPVWTALAYLDEPDAGGVTITSIEPEFDVNGNDATVEYLICELDQKAFEASGYESFGYGMHAKRLDNFCARTRPAEGADFGRRAGIHEELLVGVTPTRPGRALISAHRISFDAGWQRGSDEIDVKIQIVTPHYQMIE